MRVSRFILALLLLAIAVLVFVINTEKSERTIPRKAVEVVKSSVPEEDYTPNRMDPKSLRPGEIVVQSSVGVKQARDAKEYATEMDQQWASFLGAKKAVSENPGNPIEVEAFAQFDAIKSKESQIRLGMTPEELIQAIGEPTEIRVRRRISEKGHLLKILTPAEFSQTNGETGYFAYFPTALRKMNGMPWIGPKLVITFPPEKKIKETPEWVFDSVYFW